MPPGEPRGLDARGGSLRARAMLGRRLLRRRALRALPCVHPANQRGRGRPGRTSRGARRGRRELSPTRAVPGRWRAAADQRELGRARALRRRHLLRAPTERAELPRDGPPGRSDARGGRAPARRARTKPKRKCDRAGWLPRERPRLPRAGSRRGDLACHRTQDRKGATASTKRLAKCELLVSHMLARAASTAFIRRRVSSGALPRELLHGCGLRTAEWVATVTPARGIATECGGGRRPVHAPGTIRA